MCAFLCFGKKMVPTQFHLGSYHNHVSYGMEGFMTIANSGEGYKKKSFSENRCIYIVSYKYYYFIG